MTGHALVRSVAPDPRAAGLASRVARLRAVLRCVACGGALADAAAELACAGCGARYPSDVGRPGMQAFCAGRGYASSSSISPLTRRAGGRRDFARCALRDRRALERIASQ
jgi:hypothetical protein